MRQSTRRKYYGKSAAGGSLHSAVGDLRAAIAEAGKPPPHSPLHDALLQVAAELKRAADYLDIYKVNRKTLQRHLKKELANIEAILQELQGIPITQEQKLVAKVKKKTGR